MKSSKLEHISPDKIKANPDNPRMIFRENEMNELLKSIREVGIKVPLAVYPDGQVFRLIDGERRWKCSLRLNLSNVPAIIQPKPTKLENLLMMFNIHNVRLDWDLMPMAFKLREIQQLLTKEGKPTSPKDLAGITGLTLSAVKRALELLELPEKYQKMLLKEAEKPKDQQKIKVDLFVEINKSRNVIENYIPEVFDVIDKTKYVDSMIDKYLSGTINNVVRFRDISKIARAELVGKDHSLIKPVLVKLIKDKNFTIEKAYEETVELTYRLRDLTTKTRGLADELSNLESSKKLSEEFKKELGRIRKQINRLLGARFFCDSDLKQQV